MRRCDSCWYIKRRYAAALGVGVGGFWGVGCSVLGVEAGRLALGRFAMGRADALLDALRAMGRFAIGKGLGALGGRTERILPQAKRMDWKT